MPNVEPQHADITAALRDLHLHPTFTDLTIHLKEGPVHFSRILTAALSPVFRNMLTADMTEKKTNSVTMSHLTMETWTCITEFYFGSQKLETIDNVVDVLEASHMYQLDTLTQYCCDHMQTVCCSDNCLAIKRLAKKLSLESLAKKATKVIAENFSTVCKCEDFLCLEKSELLELLEKEELVTTEDDVCEALLAWMEAKTADADTCTELSQHVSLKKVSNDTLATVVLYHNVTTQTPVFQAKIQEELRTRLNRSASRQVRGAPERRHVRDVRDTLVTVGRNSQKKLCMYRWSSIERKWINLLDSDRPNWAVFSTAFCEGKVFITGGWRGRKDVSQFDFHRETWTAGPDLLQGRSHHGMAVIQDRVYVVAGYNETSLDSVEEFSMTTRQWSHAGNLIVATHFSGVTSLGNTILVAGGDLRESASLIQTFNIKTRTAAVLDVPLPRPMYHVQAARLGNAAFFVGSKGGLVQIIEVEGEFQMASYVLLQEFGNKKWFGLHMTDTCVRVIGGDQSLSVVCWNHQGQKVENDEVGDLPEKMYMRGVHEVDCTFP